MADILLRAASSFGLRSSSWSVATDTPPPQGPPESGLGVQSLLYSGYSPKFPATFAETPGGLLLMANGIDPILKWDGMRSTIVPAGVTPPKTALELGGTGAGKITGTLIAFQRFVDNLGNVSDLSPISNMVDMGRDGLIADVNYNSANGLVSVRSPGHGLRSSDALVIDGVEGLTLVNGKWYITVVDADTFTINGLVVTGGFYEGGGVWTLGIQTILYGAVEVPTGPTVVRRQILRNLAGSADVLYVDVDTTDLASTAFLSTTTDATLSGGTPVPLTWGDDDLPFANRNGIPPSHKAVIVSHKGRIYAGVDVEYSDGHVAVTFGSKKISGVGTDWKRTFIGRVMYISGASTPYVVEDVDEGHQVITTTVPYGDPPRPYLNYTIRPDLGDRRLIYYSEAGLPEAWPAYNALAIPETNDTIVGMVSLGQYLYVVERVHTHRMTTQSDPADGFVFLACNRGALNQRMMVVTDNEIYMMDEIGVHRFDGQATEAISGQIQTMFQSDNVSPFRIDWTADQTLWHAAHDPLRETIRWFVQMVGYPGLLIPICYNYRADRWWLEQYPSPMSSSVCATFGARRCLCGTDARRIVCLSEGTYDGITGVGTTRGAVMDAGPTHVTDLYANFASLEGSPISIVSGKGRDQTRIIAAVSNAGSTLEVVEPWDEEPDSTSIYQVGGVPWTWKSGLFRFLDLEEETARDVEVVFHPLSDESNMDIRLAFDGSSDHRVWSRTFEQDGVKTLAGSAYIEVDLRSGRGWARQRLASHAGYYAGGDRYVQVTLSGVQASEPVRISQVVITGVES